jgi:hypothetical protein
MIEALLGFWWLPFLIALAVGLRGWWLTRKINQFIEAIEWLVLEIKIPKENIKSIKAMEQVFASLHATYSFGIKRWDRYFKGRVEEWMTLEMRADAAGIRFYLVIPAKYRNLAESAFFSQYPDAEIEAVEDYTRLAPPDLPNEKIDLFGTDFILAREDAYPLKTYPAFEPERTDRTLERVIDPLAPLFEVMSNLRESEAIWLQLLIRPTGSEWVKKAEGVVNKLAGKKEEKKGGLLGLPVEFIRNLLLAPIWYPQWGEAAAPAATSAERLTPGKQDALRAVENKFNKLAFEATLRFIYFDDKDAFSPHNVSAVMGAMRQFSDPQLNSLRPNIDVLTSAAVVGRFSKEKKLWLRKKWLYYHYLQRSLPQPVFFHRGLRLKTSILNTEELATLFHPPLAVVTAAKIPVLESRKGGPPTNLPIIE